LSQHRGGRGDAGLQLAAFPVDIAREVEIS
jgi:hypothetical protein